MKQLFTALVFTLFIVNFLQAQNRTTATSSTCIAFWKNYDEKIYTIKHTKQQQKGTGETTYQVHVKVLDSTATGFKMQWVYKNFKAAGLADNAINGLNAIMEGLKITYATDEVGGFLELLNWQEVRNYAMKNYEKVNARTKHNAEFSAVLNQTKAIFNSKKNTEALLIREIQVFHTPYGVEYDTNGSISETEVPNATGGEPFPASLTLKLDELNTEKDYCTVSVNQTIDKNKAGPIIAEVIKKLAGNKPVDAAKIKKETTGLEISDLNAFTFSLADGWMKKIVYSRIANVGSDKQVETYEIVLL
jgi:hypothetical protein